MGEIADSMGQMGESEHMYLGTRVEQGEATDDRVTLDPDDLTTHGVIVGMTGSGKTGLGVIAVEEALLAGVPALVLDPKGDMANLCLRFPAARPEDFRLWIDPGRGASDDLIPEQLAADTATRWRQGLEDSGVTEEQRRRYADIPMTVYTPGSDTGVGLNLIGSLNVPTDLDADAAQEESSDIVSGLLTLLGIEPDPLTSREHILLTNLVLHARGAGKTLDVASLISQVQQPPLRKLGVMDLETFFPAQDRSELALRLNGLVASPTFAGWSTGQDLDIDVMLRGRDDTPRGAIISLAHLDADEQQFVVTLVLSRMISWMRTRSGTSSLRALIYMDEVFGFVPPVKKPPSKSPILTILKQARAFGVGMILSTQNPVDLDYKAISNAGTWMIGRLQTEGDKDRLLDGMKGASGNADVDTLGDRISALDKRQFLLHSTRADLPVVFATRWAMSYLSGPMTGPQIAALMQHQKDSTSVASTDDHDTAPSSESVQTGSLAADESPVAPPVAEGVAQRVVDPAASWAAALGAVSQGTRLVSYVAVRVRLRFDETRADLVHDQEFKAVMPVTTDPSDLNGMQAVDHDERDFDSQFPEGAVYVLPAAKVATKSWWNTLQRSVRDELHASHTMTLWHNKPLKLWSRPGETADDFAARCREVADQRQDEEAAELRQDYAAKSTRLQEAVDRAEDKAAQLQADVAARKSNELINIGTSILGGLLGGRKSARGVAADVRRAASRRGMTSRTKQRLETAQGEIIEAMEDLQGLQEDLAAELLDIDHRWMQDADDPRVGAAAATLTRLVHRLGTTL